MRNVFMRRIDNLLVDFYREIDFERLMVGVEEGVTDRLAGNVKGQLSNQKIRDTHQRKVWDLIELMRDLELISSGEHKLLIEVYGEYFSVCDC